MKQQPPERTKRLAVIAAAAVILVMVLLIIETFRLLLPGLWTAFSSGDEQALSDYLTSEGRLRSFLTLWFLAFVQVVSLVIPAMPVQLAAGIAYGPWSGLHGFLPPVRTGWRGSPNPLIVLHGWHPQSPGPPWWLRHYPDNAVQGPTA